MCRQSRIKSHDAADTRLEHQRLSLEYQEVTAELRALDGRLHRNYQWVLAASALVISSPLLVQFWSSPSGVLALIADHPGYLLALASVLIWFPAFDANMWGDYFMAESHLRDEVEPALTRLSGSHQGDAVPWRIARQEMVGRAQLVMSTAWVVRMSLPYVPAAAAMYFALGPIDGVAASTPLVLWTIAWFVVGALILIADLFIFTGYMEKPSFVRTKLTGRQRLQKRPSAKRSRGVPT